MASAMLLMTSCSSSTAKEEVSEKEEQEEVTAFYKGADISWVTEMEAGGHKFYNADNNKNHIKIYFTTDTDGALSESKAVACDIEGNSSKDFVEYVFDFSENKHWSGNITKIRVDPFDCGGSFEIDYIRFVIDKSMLEAVQKAEEERIEATKKDEEESLAEFNNDSDFENFKPFGMTGEVSGGILKGEGVERTSHPPFDPMLTKGGLNVSTADFDKVVIGMKHKLAEGKTSTHLQVFFTTDVSGGLSEAKSKKHTVSGNSSDKVVEYVLDFSDNAEWTGNITSIRFDPLDCGGTFEIDYIKVEIYSTQVD